MAHEIKSKPPKGLKGRKMRQNRAAGSIFQGLALHTPDGMERPPGQRLFFWIGQAARREREDADVSLEKIASEAGKGKEMVDRFEKGQTRPQHLEMLLVAYAHCLDIDDPRDIVAQGVRLWYEHGEAPQTQGDNNSHRV